MSNERDLSELSDAKFQELIATLQYSSLKASNLSSNVAMAFLSNIPCDVKVESNLLISNDDFDLNCIEYYEDDKNIVGDEDVMDTNAIQVCHHNSPPGIVTYGKNTKSSYAKRCDSIRLKLFSKLGNLCKSRIDNGKLSIANAEKRTKRERFYISYADLMVPSSYGYDPEYLNIPLYGRRKRSPDDIRFSSIDEMRCETPTGDHIIIPLPFESNELFRQRHPWLDSTLSLSKLCRIKTGLLALPSVVKHLDPSTSAIAWTLFERLVILGFINKSNRKIFSATCLILAYKFNQDFESDVINNIIHHLTRERTLDAKLIFSYEMKIFTLLDFSLKLKYRYIQNHIHQYLDLYNISFFNLYDTPESTYFDMDTALDAL